MQISIALKVAMMSDNSQFSDGTERFHPPCEAVKHMNPTANYRGVERRVCPNCRLFFDAGEDSDTVFCGDACRRRHGGEYQ